MHAHKIISTLSICILLITCCEAYCYGQDSPAKEDKIIARVGDTTIYLSEIIKVADKLNRFLKENFYNSEQWRMNFIKQYIVQTALAKRAIEEGLDKDEELIAELGNIKNSILADKILENKISEIVLTEQDFKDHYDQNKEKYTTKPRVKLDYAAFDSKRKATAFLAKLNNGKDFGKIPVKEGVEKQETWIAKDSPMDNPEIGPVLMTDKELDIFSLESGENSDILEKDGKFYIMAVKEKEPARLKPYEEVKRQVASEKQRQEKDIIVNAFIEETFNKLGMKIYEENITLNTQNLENHPINKIRGK